eukprot:EC097213.1.p1 GENE.EC097213.1~~EC097213.1.p1  ORF type:complete len:110 (-),score=4.67 EC097213.1:279-608(-)
MSTLCNARHYPHKTNSVFCLYFYWMINFCNYYECIVLQINDKGKIERKGVTTEHYEIICERLLRFQALKFKLAVKHKLIATKKYFAMSYKSIFMIIFLFFQCIFLQKSF